jgi:glycosyltransferase involved in cell wall biosynthesis
MRVKVRSTAVKILHVVPTYLPARRYGGPIYTVHGLCKALVARGNEVSVATTNVDGDDDSDVPLGTPVDLDGVKVHYYASQLRRLYWSPSMHKALASLVRQHDVVHLHSVFLDPTRAAARAAHRAGVPYVITPRGMLVRELIRQKSTVAKTAWLRLIERRNFEHAAAIHFTSQREWDDAKEIEIPLPSPFVVPNAIDIQPLQTLPRDNDTILFLGRITWKKGIDILIESLAHVERARLIIAGNDDEKYAPRLRELAERLGVADRVEFRGTVTGDAKETLLASVTLFALPSLSENFANVVLEAMAAATPVIVTPQVGLADDVRRSHAGVVVERDPRRLAATIDELLRDPERRAEMGARGRRLVEERFTWPRVAAEMEAHYARLRR